MKNASEVQKDFKAFHKKLKKISSENNSEPIYKTFTRWWTTAAYPQAVDVKITDEKGDGKIDAVIELPQGKFIIIQAKYNEKYEKGKAALVGRCPKAGDNSYEPFERIVIPGFDDRQKFQKYLSDQKIESIKAGYYKKAFDAKEKDPDNVTFEFITTYDNPND